MSEGFIFGASVLIHSLKRNYLFSDESSELKFGNSIVINHGCNTREINYIDGN